MKTARPVSPEHFVTFFDHRFLPQGLALHDSLRRHLPESRLWVLCLDREVESQLKQLHLPGLSILPLGRFETPELRTARQNRSWPEYVFTLTPFTFEFVFAQDPSVRRVTYVDADLFFFQNPRRLLDGFEARGRTILITEHAYGPEFAHLQPQFGRFCVQFLTVKRDETARRIIRRWAGQCLESCSLTPQVSGQVFGDQKYLEDWPGLYPDEVHICPHRSDMLAPWNIEYFQRLSGAPLWPVFYHFHSFRIFHRHWVQLCAGYNPAGADHLYKAYLHCLSRQDNMLESIGVERPVVPFNGDPFWLLRIGWRMLTRRINLRRLPPRWVDDGAVAESQSPVLAPVETVEAGDRTV